jgi:hypothetical protein
MAGNYTMKEPRAAWFDEKFCPYCWFYVIPVLPKDNEKVKNGTQDWNSKEDNYGIDVCKMFNPEKHCNRINRKEQA